jgi:hypothetical protein
MNETGRRIVAGVPDRRMYCSISRLLSNAAAPVARSAPATEA